MFLTNLKLEKTDLILTMKTVSINAEVRSGVDLKHITGFSNCRLKNVHMSSEAPRQ